MFKLDPLVKIMIGNCLNSRVSVANVILKTIAKLFHTTEKNVYEYLSNIINIYKM